MYSRNSDTMPKEMPVDLEESREVDTIAILQNNVMFSLVKICTLEIIQFYIWNLS